MIIPDDMKDTVIALKDQYFDLRGLSAYSSMGVSTLRDYINAGKLPCFKLKGKILIKKSEFDIWLEKYRLNKKQDLNSIVSDVLENLKG
ncbi:helix-turn-helix domain-containing protein [Thermodesulfobacteriota bacterium]